MAKKKPELFINIHNEKEFDVMLKTNLNTLICAEVFSYAFGSCTALQRLFNNIKLDWADGKLILLKDWMLARKMEKDQEVSAINDRRTARQAVRKRHRAELMVPFLQDINFVIFWPHCYRAHPELYEQWDANS
ncbi:hypothetical protein HF086_017836 [Spodoptera exigua]|uniref:Uncharacterized protein n=1 Tax=Spodoptera exigua TaxID=7107 RepID=A0A922MQ62_SPOEX|nr:hypothetical protein HF086_017836 [Spodoptera exigua]